MIYGEGAAADARSDAAPLHTRMEFFVEKDDIKIEIS